MASQHLLYDLKKKSRLSSPKNFQQFIFIQFFQLFIRFGVYAKIYKQKVASVFIMCMWYYFTASFEDRIKAWTRHFSSRTYLNVCKRDLLKTQRRNILFNILNKYKHTISINLRLLCLVSNLLDTRLEVHLRYVICLKVYLV